MPVLSRPRRVAGLLAAVGAAVLLPAVTPAGAAATLTPSEQQFLVNNEQTNLAELTLGQLVQQRSQNQTSLQLAQMTIADHTKAKQLVTQLAQQDGVTLPTTPNATQQSQAASLQAASAADFDRLYAQIQVQGHLLSISQTQDEINTGSDAGVKSYAETYLPLAQNHLQMAQQELSALGGSSGVAAGTGGQAATNGSAAHGWEFGLGAGLLLAAAGAVAVRRGRTASATR